MIETERIESARSALAGISLPGGGLLVESGRLSGPVIAGDRLSLAISIAPEEAAAFGPVRDAAETALRAIPGGEGALVALTAESVTPKARSGSAPKTVLSGVSHVVAVASGKGGVGKSTTAANLALGLRARGLRVGLLDADIHGPSVPMLLGLHGAPRLGPGRKLVPMPAHGIVAMSMGLMVDPETAMVWRGPMIQSALTQMLTDVDWGTLDVLVVDMPPGTGDAQLALAQSARLSGAVIVSTPQDLALIDARRGIAMFRKVNVPILGVIENMAHFLCPDCGGRHAIFGEGGAEAEAMRLDVPFLGAVPLTMELRSASDAGAPITARDPDGPLGRIYVMMAQLLWEGLSARGPVATTAG